MKRTRHAEKTTEDTAADPVVVETEDACLLRLPLQTSDDSVCAYLVLSYRCLDPLTILASIMSPSGAPVVERELLRADARMAMFEPVLLPGVTVGPAGAAGMTAFVFHEDSIAIPVTLPSPMLARFLRACDSLVPMNERAEADALTRALQDVLPTWS